MAMTLADYNEKKKNPQNTKITQCWCTSDVMGKSIAGDGINGSNLFWG